MFLLPLLFVKVKVYKKFLLEVDELNGGFTNFYLLRRNSKRTLWFKIGEPGICDMVTRKFIVQSFVRYHLIVTFNHVKKEVNLSEHFFSNRVVLSHRYYIR